MRRMPASAVLLLLLLICLFMAGCGPTGAPTPTTPSPSPTPPLVDLPFETIEYADLAGHTPRAKALNEVERPTVIVLTGPEDGALLEQFVSPDTLEKLRTLDYSTHFALIVFRGLQGYTGSLGVEIERITWQGSHLYVYTQFQYPQPGEGQNPSMSSPFHVVSVAKRGIRDQELTVDLYAHVASQPVRIP